MAPKRLHRLTISFDVKTSFDERGDYVAAYFEGFGLTVYGRDRNALRERARVAFEVWANAFAPYTGPLAITKMREFFDRHGIKHSIRKEVIPRTTLSERWQAIRHRFDDARQEFALATA